MPRPNKAREAPHEAHLARRIEQERKKRDLTYDRLAEKMTEAGCAIQGSAIYKIEHGDPPRRITVNELVTLSQVFGMRVNQLLVPADLAARAEALELFEKWVELWRKRREVMTEIDDEMAKVQGRLRLAVGGNEHAALSLRAELATRLGADSHWVDDMFEILMEEAD